MSASLFRRLRNQMVAISMGLLLLLLISVFVTIYIAMDRSFKAQSEAVLDYTVQLIAAKQYDHSDLQEPFDPDASEKDGLILSSADSTDSKRLQKPRLLDSLLLANVLVIYHDSSGRIEKVFQGGKISNDYTDLLSGEIPDFDTIRLTPHGTLTLNDVHYRYRYVSVGDQFILLMVNRESEIAGMRQLLIILMLIGTGSILILLVICFILAGRVIRPIARAWDMQQQFLHDASHELKTPLAVIATNIEAVRACPDESVASQDKWLQYIAEEAADMRQLVNDMLLLAKSDRPDTALRDKPRIVFSLSETVTEAGLLMEANALEAGICFDMQVEDNLWTVGVQNDIKHVLLILLDNALKNTFNGGRITLVLKRSHNELSVSCTNTGHGIPKEELQNIFKRFYRVDPSRARQSGGSGLGLAIADNIIRQQNGKIWAESELNEYACFTFLLPACKSEGTEK